MLSKKIRNIAYSLILLAAWTSIAFAISKQANLNPGDISALYFWTKITSLVADLGGLLLLVFRLFKSFDKNQNFLYPFFGTINLVIGLCGICFYCLHKINRIGLHDLLFNLLIGVIIIADLFLYEYLFKQKDF